MATTVAPAVDNRPISNDSSTLQDQRTFRQKYVDIQYNYDLFSALALEFLCTVVFVYAIMQIPYIQYSLAMSGLIVAFAAYMVIYAFFYRCGAIFNPCITLGLMVTGKFNLIKGTTRQCTALALALV